MTLIEMSPETAADLTPDHPLTAETRASIDRYLGAGDRMASLTDLGLKVCGGLFVLVLIAWALGVLPVAVRLF